MTKLSRKKFGSEDELLMDMIRINAGKMLAELGFSGIIMETENLLLVGRWIIYILNPSCAKKVWIMR